MDRITIGFVYYRDWAIRVLEDLELIINPLSSVVDIKSLYFTNQRDLDSINPIDFDLIFFIGWSSKISSKFHDHTKCIVLHPSNLPKYRGGSPIQNQIIDGVINTKISFFLMNSEIDKGDIIYQLPLSLEGNLSDIFDRIIRITPSVILSIILQYYYSGTIYVIVQNEQEASYFPRRKPRMSELKLNDFQELTALEIYNKIRALQDPYPNAYIKCKDNTILYITESHLKTKL